ncbi:MAG: hypothetical protein U0M15_01115, partial [Bacillota bacterium]|nr:hypothetical protein [Bacillota bacterium]
MSFLDSVKARGRDFINGGGYEEDYLEEDQYEADYEMEEEPRRASRRMRGFESTRDFDAPLAQPQKSVSHVLLYKVKKYDDARYIGDQLKNNV